jgi:tRNA U55 pseudouridine synthase TruB
MVIHAYKERGETPLDVIKRLKNENGDLKHTPMTYAGRLDPLAEGLDDRSYWGRLYEKG